MRKLLLQNGRWSLFLIALAALLGGGAAAHASADTWSWQNPLPQGNSLEDVSCPSPTLCKSVGAGGAIMSWDGADWTLDSSPTNASLNAVSCASTTSCKAVGNNGAILSWDGVAWTADASGTTESLRGVSCPSATMCKAVGANGTLRSWDGASWSGEISGTSNTLAAVACPTAGFCKAVGHDIFVTGGMVLSWSGAAWSADTLPMDTRQLYAVSCSATNQCKAAGLSGEVVSWNGTTWTADTTGFGAIRAIACNSATQCRIVGDSGIAGAWNGSTWSFESSGTAAFLSGLACPSGSSCKAVGVAGRIQTWNGSAWSAEEPSGDTFLIPLYAVTCPSASLCKAVGSSRILSWNGSSWSVDGTPSGLIRAVSCPSPTLCKAVGFSGVIFSWNGAAWSSETSGTTNNLNGVDCPSTTQCKAVGDSGTILSWNGTSWSPDTSGTTNFLFAVSCPSTTLCKAVGNFGSTRSWNGSAWSAETTGSAVSHLGISCPSTSSCKAVAAGGLIRSWNGSTWAYDVSPTTTELRAVSCSSPTRCKAVGPGGATVSFDGVSWSNDLTPSANDLNGVGCAPSSPQCVTVGAVTSILATNLEGPPSTATPTVTPTPPSTSTPTSTPTSPPSQGGPDFVVNSAADSSDGDCDVLGSGAGNQDCTLREAVVAANSNPDTSTITFDIPSGAGCSAVNVCTILLGSTLPSITRPLAIDGAANAASITLDGGNGEAGGVRIMATSSSATSLSLTALNLVDGSSTAGSAISSAFVSLTITNCTFANNYASGGAGAVHADNRPVSIVNTTFHANKGTSAGAVLQGGLGIGAQMTIINSTFSQNTSTFSPSTGAASIYSNGSPVVLRNTILVKPGASTNNNCLGSGGGSFSANGFNFANDSTCGSATNSAGILLDPLGNNGGPTLTQVPSAGSVVIDAGDPAVCSAGPVSNLDQRGYFRPAGAQCDSGAVETASGPPPTATPTGTSTHTPTDTMTPTATATLLPHDSVVLPVKPLTFKLTSRNETVVKNINVKVVNADIHDAGIGHLIQLSVSNGECPSGTVAGLPDFDKDTPGNQDTVLLAAGKSAKATIPIEASSGNYSTFNRKAPARCVMHISVSSPDGDDPTPGNNSVPLEINVIDANDGEQSAVHESFIVSLKPLKITIGDGDATKSKTTKVKVGNADILPEAEEPGDLLTVVALDDDCPAGTLGIADYDGDAAGEQNTVTVAGGKTQSGKLKVTATSTEFTARNPKSPARCVAAVSVSGPGGDTDGNNGTSNLVIDVYDGNDF